MNRTPAEDRAHWEQTADRLLLAVRPYAAPGHALIDLPGVPSLNGAHSDGLEGFARTFLLAGFRLAGAGGADPHDLAGWYAAGLAAGTDPAHPGRWPTFAESNQAKVEAASVALALHETRPWIWDRLDDRVRQQVLDWLAPMVGNLMPGNNWIWFQAVTEAFARTVGGPWLQQDLDRTIALTDGWYAGEGWYSDGLTGAQHRNFDHYNGWAMHLYPLWFCRILGDAAPAGLLDRYRARLRRLLADQRLLVGGNGSPLVQGRSLTYRHAALAPLWTGALFDATPLAPGETRAIADRTLDHFTRHGATDDRGLLTLGWHRPYRGVLQGYSGPASPYWASKGFIGLALPPDHPVWTEEATALPVERGDFTRTLAVPGWLVSGTAADGVVRVVNHGGDHADPGRPHADDPCYARFGYSTHTAPETPGDSTAGPGSCPGAEPLDNTVVLLDARGPGLAPAAVHPDLHRRRHRRLALPRARWPEDASWDVFGGPDTEYRLGPWLTVGSALRGSVEVRAVRVDPAAGDATGERYPLRIAGWALAADSPSATAAAVDGAAARVAGGGLVSQVTGVLGVARAFVVRSKDSNALGAASLTPVVQTEGPVGLGGVCVALVHLGGSDPAALPEVATRTEGADVLVDVAWPDGAHDTVRLPAPAADTAVASADSAVDDHAPDPALDPRKDPSRA